MKFLAKYLAVLSFLFLLSCNDWLQKADPDPSKDGGPGWKLIWSDEFNGTELDMTKWSYDLGAGGWGNDELQGYTSNKENIRLEDGKLVIRACRTSNDYIPFSSARIHTKDKFGFQYGKMVARIRLPYGTGIWPALWLMGTNKSEVGWPQCGEFDFVEMKGGGPMGDSIVFSTAHWFSGKTFKHAFAGNQEFLSNSQGKAVPFSDDYHVFTMIWTSNAIDTYFENTHIMNIVIKTNWEQDMQVYHKPFYILLNMAVGGTMSKIFMGSMVPGEFPRTMWVDYIRVYQEEATTDKSAKELNIKN